MRIERPEGHYDIVVVGGGLVGAGFALLLQALKRPAADPLRVLVVEAAGHAAIGQSGVLEPAADFDVRTTALSHGSRLIYEQMGLWSTLREWATPIEHIHVSDKGRFGAVDMDAAEAGVDALGYVVENQHLGKLLLHALQQSDEIELLCPASIDTAAPLPDGMRLGLSANGESFSVDASLLVLADGGKSPVCSQLGIAMDRTVYGQQALIANIAFRKPHRGVAYERFTDQGPMAVLPLADLDGEHRGALIWTQPDEAAAALQSADEADFLQALQSRFGYRLGEIYKTGQRHCFPLALTVAREQVRPGLVLLGNVAHTLHPVAGQGLNLALRDARALAQRLHTAHADGEAPGQLSVLQDYVHCRQRDQALTIAFSHHVTGLFTARNPLQVWTRKFGLFSIDLIPPARQLFTRQAMGMG